MINDKFSATVTFFSMFNTIGSRGRHD